MRTSGSGPGSSDDLIPALKDALARSVTGNIELAGRVRDLVRDLAAGAPAAVRDPQLRRQLVARWLTFNVVSLRAIADSSLELMNAIVSAAETTLLQKQPGAAVANGASALPAVVEAADIVLQGRRGERVDAPFLLENHSDDALDVTFEVQPLHAAGRPELPGSLVTLDPANAAIPAKGQTIVHAIVDLADAFAPGAVYATTVRLVGYDARSMRLNVRVAEEAAAPRKPRARKHSPVP